MDKVELKFSEPKALYSQQTIVKVLRERQYYFKPINEYENTQFYCIIRCRKQNWGGKILTFLFADNTDYVECPLMIDVCGDFGKPIVEPFVFTRDDVVRIISDVPETYVGESIL